MRLNLDNMTNNRDFLISLCQRYKGEKQNPNPRDSVWRYERFWVEENMKDDPDFGKFLDDYLGAGLRTFNMYDDTPATLKAVLFNRFMQQAEGMATIDEFKHWYDAFYRK